MPTLVTLASFQTSTTGGILGYGLIADSQGDLFGTTDFGPGTGSTTENGSVFELTYGNGNYAASPTTIGNLGSSGNGGSPPIGELAIDSAGDLFGVTHGGGVHFQGSLLEIQYTAGSYTSSADTVVSFNGTNGNSPDGGVLIDGTGDLIGTTYSGGANGDGTIFEIVDNDGSYASTPTPVVTFSGSNGAHPTGALLKDAAGDLFGITTAGGGNNAGTVFEVVNSATGYASMPQTLISFSTSDGFDPSGGLAMDAAGDLFETTPAGGTAGDGTVFEIIDSGGNYASIPTTLVTFDGSNGATPYGTLIVDAAGNLFGTTSAGGTLGDGTVFEVPDTAGIYASSPITLGTFDVTNGAMPNGGLLADAAGNLFGTTLEGGSGSNADGTVFEVTGTGFVVACYRSGTRLATPTGDQAIERLSAGDRVITQAGEARPIIWVGHRHIDCRRQPIPQRSWPIHIVAGAFGEGAPHRSLWLSPDHSIFVEGMLIPAKCLINGTTIVQERSDEVTYWHVELEQHDVLLAEGLPCESFLDTGNRSAFDEGGNIVQMRPDFASWRWEAEACGPLVVTGPILEQVRARLAERNNTLMGIGIAVAAVMADVAA